MENWEKLAHIILVIHHFGRREDLMRERARIIDEIDNNIRYSKHKREDKNASQGATFTNAFDRDKRSHSQKAPDVSAITERTKDNVGVA